MDYHSCAVATVEELGGEHYGLIEKLAFLRGLILLRIIVPFGGCGVSGCIL